MELRRDTRQMGSFQVDLLFCIPYGILLIDSSGNTRALTTHAFQYPLQIDPRYRKPTSVQANCYHLSTPSITSPKSQDPFTFLFSFSLVSCDSSKLLNWSFRDGKVKINPVQGRVTKKFKPTISIFLGCSSGDVSLTD